jgi:hypothetical protein
MKRGQGNHVEVSKNFSYLPKPKLLTACCRLTIKSHTMGERFQALKFGSTNIELKSIILLRCI